MKQITGAQIKERLKLENPWWEPPHTISEMFTQVTPRPYLDLLYPLLMDRNVNRAVVLMGPRRVGKTWILHHAIQKMVDEGADARKIFYVSTEHPLYNGMMLEEFITLFFEIQGLGWQDECSLFFDEIQYMKQWEVQLKALVDRFPKLKITVSGSVAAALKLKSYESGAGRFTDFLLPPLTFHEYLTMFGSRELLDHTLNTIINNNEIELKIIKRLNNDFMDYINYGGYPELAAQESIRSNPARYIKSDIIDKVLLRDLPSLYGIQDIQELNNLFTVLSYNTANEVSLEGLSQLSGISKNTIKKYIEYLEAAFLVKTVHRVDKNARKFRRATTFKVYLTNPSMRAAMFSPVDSSESEIGALVETAVFSQWFHAPLNHIFGSLHYARWDRGEIDIIAMDMANAKILQATEVKWSDRVIDDKRIRNNILLFCHKNNLKEAVVTTKTISKTILLENVRIEFRPTSAYSAQVAYFMTLARTSTLLPDKFTMPEHSDRNPGKPSSKA